MPDDGISPQYGHVWVGDAQVVAALGYTAVTDDGDPHFFDAPSDSANPVTLAPGTAATQIWKRIYHTRTKTQSYELMFNAGQTLTTANIAAAEANDFSGVL